MSDMMNAGLELYDPFVGHMIAIAASIQLEHTLSKTPAVAKRAHRNFQRSRKYIERLAKKWPIMNNTVS